MQNITQTIVQLNITHRSVQLHGFTPSRFSVLWVGGWRVVTKLHPNNPSRLSSTLAVRFFYCLWSLNHPQRDFPSNTDGHPQVCTLVAFYIWYKSLPRQCQLLCRMDTSIFRRRIGKNIEIYCCCILQNYREPIQCQCIPSNNTLNYV